MPSGIPKRGKVSLMGHICAVLAGRRDKKFTIEEIQQELVARGFQRKRAVVVAAADRLVQRGRARHEHGRAGWRYQYRTASTYSTAGLDEAWTTRRH